MADETKAETKAPRPLDEIAAAMEALGTGFRDPEAWHDRADALLVETIRSLTHIERQDETDIDWPERIIAAYDRLEKW